MTLYTGDYLEYYLTLVAWVISNGIWNILVASGVFAIPFIAIIMQEWLKARSEGVDEGNKGALSAIRIENRVWVTTGQSTDISAWEDVRIGAKDHLSILAVEEELKLIANKGQMKIQAQHNQMEIASQKGMKVISTENRIEIAAEKEILLTCGGGYIRIADGNIYIHTPGVIDHKAASYPFAPPASMNYRMPSFNLMNLDPLDYKVDEFFIFSE